MVKLSENIDLSCCPITYWPESLTPDQLISQIHGKARQNIARNIFHDKGFVGLTTFIVRQELGKKDKAVWGALHPMFMGGEYLPSLDDGEVEIVRISLQSTTGDQVSVRAKREGEIIKYQIVDEYAMQYKQPFHESKGPLTLERLIYFIDNSFIPDDIYSGGLVVANWYAGYEGSGDVDEGISFVSISSPFYPELTVYYQALAKVWREDNIEPEEDEF